MKINQQAFLTAWNNQKLVKGAFKGRPRQSGLY